MTTVVLPYIRTLKICRNDISQQTELEIEKETPFITIIKSNAFLFYGTIERQECPGNSGLSIGRLHELSSNTKNKCLRPGMG